MQLVRDKNWNAPPPKPKPTIAEVTERLRKSKQEHAVGMAQWGREKGEQWATEFAEYDELRRVAELARQPGWPYQDADAFCVMAAGTVGGETTVGTFFRLKPDGDERLYDDRDFLIGFVEGAGEVWRQVEPLL